MQVEKATYDADLPHAREGDGVNCDLCGRNADHIIHTPFIEQAAHHGEPLATEKGS